MEKSEAPGEESALSVFEAAAYTVPRVNLLPPEVGERRKLRKVQAGLAVGILGVAGVVGLLYVQAGSGESTARASLETAQVTNTSLQAQADKLAYVSKAKQQIDAAKASLKAAMGSEVLWSKTMQELQRRLPDGVRFTNVAVVGDGPLANSAGTGASTSKSATTTATGGTTVPSNTVATITIQGKADTMDDVAAELDQLELVTGFSNVYLSSATRPAGGDSDQTVTFTATADITNAVLSHRYDSLTGD